MAAGLMTPKVVCLIASLLEYRYLLCAWLLPSSQLCLVLKSSFLSIYEFDCRVCSYSTRTRLNLGKYKRLPIEANVFDGVAVFIMFSASDFLVMFFFHFARWFWSLVFLGDDESVKGVST